MSIDDLIFNAIKSKNQKNKFSENHVRYDTFIAYNDKSIVIEYQCNPKFSTPDIISVLDCILMDAISYIEYKDPFDFINDFGYEDLKEAKKAYCGCKKEYEQLIYLLGNEEEIYLLRQEVDKKIGE